MAHDGVTAGVACKGTAMERHTLKVKDKAFLFVGATDAMVKLAESLAEAKRLAKAEPARYQVGKTAWVKLMFSADAPPPTALVKRWIAESYGLIAGATPARAAPRTPRRTRSR